MLDGRRLTLGRLTPGEQFAYEFDFGDRWTHLSTVAERRIDPLKRGPARPTAALLGGRHPRPVRKALGRPRR